MPEEDTMARTTRVTLAQKKAGDLAAKPTAPTEVGEDRKPSPEAVTSFKSLAPLRDELQRSMTAEELFAEFKGGMTPLGVVVLQGWKRSMELAGTPLPEPMRVARSTRNGLRLLERPDGWLRANGAIANGAPLGAYFVTGWDVRNLIRNLKGWVAQNVEVVEKDETFSQQVEVRQSQDSQYARVRLADLAGLPEPEDAYWYVPWVNPTRMGDGGLKLTVCAMFGLCPGGQGPRVAAELRTRILDGEVNIWVPADARNIEQWYGRRGETITRVNAVSGKGGAIPPRR